jgi:hypothetical protein
MVITTYKITYALSKDIHDWVITEPNYIQTERTLGPTDQPFVIFTFDHTPAQALAFKKLLATKIGLLDDSIGQYVNPRGGVEMYSTDVARVFTNIGITFVNVYNRSDGMSFGMDTGPYDTVKIIVHWTKAGTDTGVHSLQIIDKATSTVLTSFSPLVTGVNVGTTNAIPATFLDTSKLYLIQAKSTVVADDPTFEGIRVYMR